MVETELPDSPLERAKTLENLMISKATGGYSVNNTEYEFLRRELMGDAALKPLLPDFVRTCRSLDVFWPYIKEKSKTWAERRQFISNAFTPLIEHLEGRVGAPADAHFSDALETFDSDGVHSVWTKALARRDSDPEGAITVARTLLETVCKRILDDSGIAYSDRDDLPKLYGLVARSLNLGPDQHSEEAIKSILGGVITVVNGIGTLRNKLSDSHGRGGAPVRPAPRHASLAVNVAGALATFLVETHVQKSR